MSTFKTALKRYNGSSWDQVGLAGFADIILRENETETIEESFQNIEASLLNKVDGVFKIYKSFSEIGGSYSTPNEAIAAMENGSMAIIGVTSVATPTWPATNGTFLAFRISQELAMAFFQPVTTNSLYTAVYYKSVSSGQETWTGWQTYMKNTAYDDTPTEDSDNLVTSGVVYTAIEAAKTTLSQKDTELENALNTLQQSLTSHSNDANIHVTTAERQAWNAKQNALTFDDTPTAGSNNPVTSAGIKSALDLKAESDHNHDGTYVKQSSVGASNGVAPLGADQKIEAQYLPSYVDDVIDGTLVSTTVFNDTDGSPVTPESGKIYVDTTTNKSYRWSGSVYAEIGGGVALGETSSTAYRGDRGKIAYDHSQTATTRSNTTASQTLTNGGTFQAVSLVSDNGGHVTGVQTKTFTLPNIASGNSTVSQTSQPTNQKEGDLWFETIA